jgi:hypothetical protein
MVPVKYRSSATGEHPAKSKVRGARRGVSERWVGF